MQTTTKTNEINWEVLQNMRPSYIKIIYNACKYWQIKARERREENDELKKNKKELKESRNWWKWKCLKSQIKLEQTEKELEKVKKELEKTKNKLKKND